MSYYVPGDPPMPWIPRADRVAVVYDVDDHDAVETAADVMSRVETYLGVRCESARPDLATTDTWSIAAVIEITPLDVRGVDALDAARRDYMRDIPVLAHDAHDAVSAIEWEES